MITGLTVYHRSEFQKLYEGLFSKFYSWKPAIKKDLPFQFELLCLTRLNFVILLLNVSVKKLHIE